MFLGGATESRARKRFSVKELFVYVTITSDLGSEKFVLASESNLLLVTGLAS